MELIIVKPTKKFLDYRGGASITQICDKERNAMFRNNEVIEVSAEQFEVLKKLGWCEEVKDGN